MVARVGEPRLRGIRMFPFDIEAVFRFRGEACRLPVGVLFLEWRYDDGESILSRVELDKRDAAHGKLRRRGVVQEGIIIEMYGERSLPRQKRGDRAMGEDERVEMIGKDGPSGVVNGDARHPGPVQGAEQRVVQPGEVRHPRLHRPGTERDSVRAGGVLHGAESVRLQHIPCRRRCHQ